MGNVHAYADYWSKLQHDTRQDRELNIIDRCFTITNTHSYRTYYVTKRLKHSQLLFLATNDAGEEVFVKIFEMTAYEEVRQLNLYLKEIKDKLTEEGLVKVLDYFFTLEKHKWVFVIVEECVNGVTLESWLQDLSSGVYASSNRVDIPADHAVTTFYDVVRQVKEAHEKGLVLTTITTTNVMLERTSQISSEAMLICGDEAYVMKVAPYKVPGSRVPKQYLPPEGLSNRESYDIWCCGIVLLSVRVK